VSGNFLGKAFPQPAKCIIVRGQLCFPGVVKVTDMGQIVAYDVLKTPGLVINEKLVSSGRIPTAATIAEWIRAA